MPTRITALRLGLLLVCCLQTACYYTQAIGGQLDLLSRREPIDELLADPSLPEEFREQLEMSVAVREFAVSALGLPDNDSYRNYADVERPFVVWSVVAAPEFSVAPLQWCFPVIGCVSYRGYFKEEKAQHFAGELDAGGYDTMVGGVPAYSTLGRFSDPVLNTMLRFPDTRFAGIVFHELAHQKLYIKDDTAFNEAFATAVQEEGVRRWLAATAPGPDDALLVYGIERERVQLFAALVRSTRDELEAMYALDLPDDEKRARKAGIFEQLKERYGALKADGFGGYDAWFDRPLNNADLAAVATYHELLPGFEALLADSSGDLELFYANAEALGAQEPEIRRKTLKQLSESYVLGEEFEKSGVGE